MEKLVGKIKLHVCRQFLCVLNNLEICIVCVRERKFSYDDCYVFLCLCLYDLFMYFIFERISVAPSLQRRARKSKGDGWSMNVQVFSMRFLCLIFSCLFSEMGWKRRQKHKTVCVFMSEGAGRSGL